MTQCFPTSAMTVACSPIQLSRPMVTRAPRTRLFADGNIEPINAVLSAPVGDRDMGTDEHVVLEGHVTDAAEESHVHVLPDLRGRVGENCAERKTATRLAPAKDHAVESPAKIDSGPPRDEGKGLGPAGEGPLGTDRPAAQLV